MKVKRALAVGAFAAVFLSTSALSQQPDGELRVLHRVEPEFPLAAVRARHDIGVVKARITVDASGNVTQVEVLEARPRTLFDRSVIDALSQWKFAKGPAGRTLETQVDFRR